MDKSNHVTAQPKRLHSFSALKILRPKHCQLANACGGTDEETVEICQDLTLGSVRFLVVFKRTHAIFFYARGVE